MDLLLANARMYLRDFRVDGLRLDAIQAIRPDALEYVILTHRGEFPTRTRCRRQVDQFPAGVSLVEKHKIERESEDGNLGVSAVRAQASVQATGASAGTWDWLDLDWWYGRSRACNRWR